MSYTELVTPAYERLASVTGQRPVRVDQIRGYLPSLTGTNGAGAQVIARVGAAVTYITTAGAFEVLSSSANDTAAGTGARTIEVKGLDSSWNEFTETVTMNGVTPVALVNSSAFRINSAKVLTAGSGLTNAGNIDVRTVTGSTVYKSIPAAVECVGMDFDFRYTVPAGMIGILMDLSVSYYRLAAGTTGSMQFFLNTVSSAGILRGIWGQGVVNSVTAATASGEIVNRQNLLLPIDPKSTLDLRGFVEAAPGSATPVRAQGTILLFKDGTVY